VLITKPYIHEKFFVLNGDDLFSQKDLRKISRHAHCDLVEFRENASAFGVMETKGDLVINVIEKPPYQISGLVNTGMCCFSPDVFEILETLQPSPRGEYELTDAMKILAQQQKFHYEQVSGYWIPVGYPWHILEATKRSCAKRKRKF